MKGDENNETLREFYSKERLSPILGDEDFIADAKAVTETLENEHSYFERQGYKPSIETIVDVVSDAYGIESAEVYQSKKVAEPKKVREAWRCIFLSKSGGIGFLI